ncbi:MAG: hypothetical protein HKN25_12165 [Pyrinomonadaceae bacterium]|nr:hypothetical protein [Pyrinomonadaceae bacterium]
MLRIILGVIVGFVVWSVVFVGGEALVKAIAPGAAAPDGATYVGSVSILLGYLVRSIIASILAGFIGVLVAAENSKTPLILGIVLLAVGIMVQASAWSMLPVWYHLIFLALLIPMTIVGGKLKKQG